jgi:chromosome segregation ATPase
VTPQELSLAVQVGTLLVSVAGAAMYLKASVKQTGDKVGELSTRMAAVESGQQAVREQVARMDEKLTSFGAGLAAHTTEEDAHFNEFRERFHAQGGTIQSAANEQATLKERLSSLAARVDRLESCPPRQARGNA